MLLFGCAPSLSLRKEGIDAKCLASAYVGSPDPRRKDPPIGEQLLIKWRASRKEMEKNLALTLEIVYKDLSRETLSHSISQPRGFLIHSLLGEKRREKGGYLTYKVDIRDQRGEILKEWKQQLWVEEIVID